MSRPVWPAAFRLALLGALAAAGAGCVRRIEVVETPPAAEAPAPEREGLEIAKPPYITWDRQPTVVEIPGTGVAYLQEFDKDEIYRAGGKWYRFYRGHWFVSTENWQGPWLATTDVPGGFLKIPRGHPRYRIVRRHPDYGKP